MNEDIELLKRETYLNEYVEFVLMMIKESPGISEKDIEIVRNTLEIAKFTQMAMLRLESMTKRARDDSA